MLTIRGVFTSVFYDETSLTVWHKQARPKERSPAVPDDRQGLVGKIQCAEYDVAVLTQEVAHPDKWRCHVLSLPCPAQLLERGTGEVLKHCLESITWTPFLRHAQNSDSKPFVCDLLCCDRAGASARAEDGLYAQAVDLAKRLRMPCYAHTTSTSQGRGFAPAAADFTGLIAGALSMGQAGSTESLRLCIESVLVLLRLPVRDAPRFPENHEAAIYLRELLLECTQSCSAGSKPADVLVSLFTRDVRETYVELSIPGGSGNIGGIAAGCHQMLCPAQMVQFLRDASGADAPGKCA